MSGDTWDTFPIPGAIVGIREEVSWAPGSTDDIYVLDLDWRAGDWRDHIIAGPAVNGAITAGRTGTGVFAAVRDGIVIATWGVDQ